MKDELTAAHIMNEVAFPSRDVLIKIKVLEGFDKCGTILSFPYASKCFVQLFLDSMYY